MQIRSLTTGILALVLSMSASYAQFTNIFSRDNQAFIPPQNRSVIVTGYPLG